MVTGMPIPSHLAGQKIEPKMAAQGVKICASVSVVLAVLYVSSSPLYDFNLQVFIILPSIRFPAMENVFRRNITRVILHIRVFKRVPV